MREIPCERAQRGVSLIEAMMVTVIASILVGAAVPSWRSQTERWRLEGHGAELLADLHYARSEAVARNRNLRIAYAASPGGTCYVIHDGGAGDCRCVPNGGPQCAPGVQPLKTVSVPSGEHVAITANVGEMAFSATHGTTTPAGSINLQDSQGRTLRHVVNVLGRVRSCSPGSTLPGYKPC